MTVESLPGVINDETLDAKHWRHITQAILGAAVGSFAGGVSATRDLAHGVCGPTDLKVSQAGTPAMKVQVAAGLALITGTVSAEQGPYSFYNDAAVELNLSAADATNPRRDLIIAQVRDDTYSGATNDARLTVVTGTPAGSPSDPSLSSYPNALVLARVAVAAGATSITNANITDLRTKAGTWFLPRGLVADPVKHTSNSAAFTSVANIMNDLTFTSQLYRRYKLVAQATFSQTANATAAQNMIAAEGAGNTQYASTSEYTGSNGAGETTTHVIPGLIFDGTGSSMTWRIRGVAGSSAVMVGSATAPSWFYIEDMGGVLA